MNLAALAASQIAAQMALTQSQVQVGMIRHQHKVQQEMISMVTQSAQNAPVPSGGTGVLLNVYA
jgi:hypothetical protein